MQPQSVRSGLWNFAATLALPGTSRWLPGGGGTRLARYAIDAAIGASGIAHVAVPAEQLARRGPAAERVLERVVAHAARRRQHGLLAVTTLGGAALSLAQQCVGQPSRSILRPAA
jgi:hypothetical protein